MCPTAYVVPELEIEPLLVLTVVVTDGFAAWQW